MRDEANRPTNGRTRPGTGLITVLLALLLAWSASLVISRPVERPAAGYGDADAPNTWPDMRLDVNEASAAELTLLPGIGPRLADRIVAHRREHGPFQTIDDLQQVPMIGPVTAERIEPYLVIIDERRERAAGDAAP